MKSALFLFKNDALSRHHKSDDVAKEKVQLALCFGAKNLLQRNDLFNLLRRKFPAAHIMFCSTAGEIYNTEVLDDSITITALEFDDTPLASYFVEIKDFVDSYSAGQALIDKFNTENMNYVMVISDGSKVNGSELVRGMSAMADQKILITGGLAGDGSNFHSTLVGLNEQPREGIIAAIGFYGNKLKVNHGSQGGWEIFGDEMKVTKSVGNQLYELNGENALEIYKRNLGRDADDLPGAALLFPLAIILPGTDKTIVRTILTIDEETGSMIYAGDIPEGSSVCFMKANFDKLTEAASNAAFQTHEQYSEPPNFALLVSCVGRKLILQSRIEDEIEAVNMVFKEKTLLAGFYSYGEISPFVSGDACQLHNQTMTITTFHELN
jgi:hypothetical protein